MCGCAGALGGLVPRLPRHARHRTHTGLPIPLSPLLTFTLLPSLPPSLMLTPRPTCAHLLTRSLARSP
eukprot:2113927-Rhodomonas_salina.1